MEDKDKKKNVKKIIVYAVLLVLIMGIALGTGQIQTEELGRIFTVNAVAVCKLLLLIFGVLFLKSLIVWILGLIKPANHRARSVLSLLSSLTKYIAFLVILCAGLTILGVNMTTIIASVGVLALIVGFSAESLIADVVTGTFMLLENQYNVGDIVEVNGEKWILSKRHKTKVPFQVKLLDIPLQIIERYKLQQENNLVFPNLNYWSVCKPLKKMIKECGITNSISFHCSRHGFATLALSKGMPIESVSRVWGHTNIVTIQLYAKITIQKIDDDLTRFGNKLNQSFNNISMG